MEKIPGVGQFFRSGKLRSLYLFAQLLGGSVALLHVTVYRKPTLRQPPHRGVCGHRRGYRFR